MIALLYPQGGQSGAATGQGSATTGQGGAQGSPIVGERSLPTDFRSRLLSMVQKQTPLFSPAAAQGPPTPASTGQGSAATGQGQGNATVGQGGATAGQDAAATGQGNTAAGQGNPPSDGKPTLATHTSGAGADFHVQQLQQMQGLALNKLKELTTELREPKQDTGEPVTCICTATIQDTGAKSHEEAEFI